MSPPDNVSDAEQVTPPTATMGSRTERVPREKVAVWFPEGSEPSQFPEDWTRIPEHVAQEMALDDGQKLVVEQRPVMHWEDGELVRTASDDQGYVDHLELLQAVVDATVVDSNFGLPELRVHPTEEGQQYLKAPHLVWWLVDWLGVRDLVERVSAAAGRDVEGFRKGSGESSKGRTLDRTPPSMSDSGRPP